MCVQVWWIESIGLFLLPPVWKKGAATGPTTRCERCCAFGPTGTFERAWSARCATNPSSRRWPARCKETLGWYATGNNVEQNTRTWSTTTRRRKALTLLEAAAQEAPGSTWSSSMRWKPYCWTADWKTGPQRWRRSCTRERWEQGGYKHHPKQQPQKVKLWLKSMMVCIQPEVKTVLHSKPTEQYIFHLVFFIFRRQQWRLRYGWRHGRKMERIRYIKFTTSVVCSISVFFKNIKYQYQF